MPTESDFLDAAQFFENAGNEVSDVPGPVAGAFGGDVLTGGQLTLEIEALIAQVTGGCAADNNTLLDLAQLCRERAQIVANYEGAMQNYGRQMMSHSYTYNRWLGDVRDHNSDPEANPWPGSRPRSPSRPRKPYAWIEL